MKKSTILLIASVIVVAVGAGLLLFFSSKSADNSGVSGNSQTNQQSSTEAKSESKKSDKADELPAWVSENYPLYPESDVYLAKPTTSRSGSAYNIGTTVSGDRAEIEQWYKDQYSTNGWAADNHSSETIKSTKGDYSVMIIVAKTLTSKNDVVVTISATQK